MAQEEQTDYPLSEIRTGTIRVIKPRCEGKVANIVGTNEPDRLKGTSGADVIPALGGNDVIDGRGGNGRCLFWTNHSVNTRHKFSLRFVQIVGRVALEKSAHSARLILSLSCSLMRQALKHSGFQTVATVYSNRDQLKSDYPRVPLTSDKKLFDRLSELGNELLKAHLLNDWSQLK